MLAVLHAAQLVTLAGPNRARVGGELGELSIIRDGGLLIDGERIVAVGTSSEIEKRLSSDAEIIDASGKVVLPGFVDAHTHLVFAGNRLDDFEARARGETYEQIAKRGGGIQTTVRATRAASEEELFALAKTRAGWFLRNSTTTVEAKSGYGLTVEDELKILRVIRRIGAETPLETVSTFLGAHAVPPEVNREQYLGHVIEEMLPRVDRTGEQNWLNLGFCERRDAGGVGLFQMIRRRCGQLGG